MTGTRNIHPVPYSVEYSEGFIELNGQFDLRVGCGISSELLALWDELLSNFTAGTIRLNSTVDASLPEYCAVWGKNGAKVDEEYSYTIHANCDGIALEAKDLQGIRYAWYTFLQLLQRRGDDRITAHALPYCVILDKPCMEFRGLHICIFPDTTLDTIKKELYMAAFAKLNYVVVESWGGIKLDTFPCWKDKGYTKDELRPIFEKARLMGLELIPLFNSVGHAPASRDAQGKNVILEIEPQWTMYFEPYEYDWCISNPAVPVLLRKIRHELYDLFGESKYFHIGGDEAFFLATCDRCRSFPVKDLVRDYLNNLCAEIESEGRRMMMWSDMYLDPEDWKDHDYVFANSKPERPLKEILPELDKRIIITDWQYGVLHEDHTATHFMEHGFDTILSSFRHPGNAEALARSAKSEKTMGLLLTTWSWAEREFPFLITRSSLLWHEEELSFIQPTIISTSIIRKLCPSDGIHDLSGWVHDHFEVDG